MYGEALSLKDALSKHDGSLLARDAGRAARTA
jgi:hypothetical protein